MKTQWDYSNLAESYQKRPSYAKGAISFITENCNLVPDDPVADIGAGVAHLTLELAALNLRIDAVEPNDEMRSLGMTRTKNLKLVRWKEATAESTTLPSSTYKLVTFGSSFNVTDKAKALSETKRIAIPQGWFAALWNHRNLNDKIQQQIEQIIHSHIKNYNYGSRREDQSKFLYDSGYFSEIIQNESPILHEMYIEDVIVAWKSHATLQRQAGKRFSAIIEEISLYLGTLAVNTISIPYTTRTWLARLK